MNYVYIVRCSDGRLYTGWTTDVDRRISAHNQGRGAKFTRGRGPVHLVHLESFADRSDALKREAAIKRLTRHKKELLIAGKLIEDEPCDHTVK